MRAVGYGVTSREMWGHVTTSQPQWIGVTVWNGEMWMLRRANHMHSDAASQGGGWWQG